MSTLKIPVSSNDHIQGNANAPITIVEYGDYQCPYCAKAHYIVKKLQKHFDKQIRFVFRNFPLTQVHPYAEPAAEIAEFAAEQGRFWEMHDLIYENQKKLSLPLLFELAERLKLPTDTLDSVIENNIYKPKIRSDFLGGVRSGVNGTPTFFINDHRHNGSFELEDLIEAVDSALQNA